MYRPYQAKEEGWGMYQHPPGASRRSNTRMVSNTFSCARASMVMAPAGPAPITATLLIAPPTGMSDILTG